MNEGEARRAKLLEILKQSTKPVSGSALSGQLKVSRQVIVQDIALLRATHKDILATTRGYVLYSSEAATYHRSYCVSHDDKAIEDELCTIIDNGGKVLDVTVEHEVYGQIRVDLVLGSRSEVRQFMKLLKETKAKPLSLIAGGVHYHLVEAASEVILDNIERALKEKGYLISS